MIITEPFDDKIELKHLTIRSNDKKVNFFMKISPLQSCYKMFKNNSKKVTSNESFEINCNERKEIKGNCYLFVI